MYDEINSFVSYVKDAAERAARPRRWPLSWWGNRETARPFSWILSAINTGIFLSQAPTANITFRFTGLDKLGGYGKITTIESQTYEDPMILAMNLSPTIPGRKP
jgi:serine protein kinase